MAPGRGAALAASAIDDAAGTLEGAVDGADLVVLAAPPHDASRSSTSSAGPVAAFLGNGRGRDGHRVHQERDRPPRDDRSGVRFVGGHPMAGRETTGFGAADADAVPRAALGRRPGSRRTPEAVARVEALARACGANPFTLDARAHDSYVAAISHMPLVVSAALVEAVAGTGAQPRPRLGLGGGARGRRLGLDDAARARRRHDGRGDRHHEPRGDREPAA